jgi:hypothetical protein
MDSRGSSVSLKRGFVRTEHGPDEASASPNAGGAAGGIADDFMRFELAESDGDEGEGSARGRDDVGRSAVPRPRLRWSR